MKVTIQQTSSPSNIGRTLVQNLLTVNLYLALANEHIKVCKAY